MISPLQPIAAVAVILACQLPAQFQLGAIASTPVAFVRGELQEPLYMAAGANSAPPSGLTLASEDTTRESAPDYRLNAMFEAADLAELIINAFSTGNDNVPVDSLGQVDPGAGDPGWVILAFGVSDSIENGNGDLAIQRATGLPMGSDIYSYGVPGSVNIAPQYLGNVVLTHTAAQLNTGPSQPEIVGFDLLAPLLIANNGVRDEVFLNNLNDDFFFSVSPASAIDLNNMLNPTGNPAPPAPPSKFTGLTVDAGTVYRISYSTTTGSWGSVTEFQTASQLALANLSTQTPFDIDALAVRAGGTPSIIFSLADVTAEQLLVQTAPNLPSIPLLDANGDLITTSLGLPAVSPPGSGEPNVTGNNIDSLCGIDPEIGSYSRVIGTPAPLQPWLMSNTAQPMSLSVSLHYEPNMPVGDELDAVLSGWQGLPQTGGDVFIHILQDADINANGYLIGSTTGTPWASSNAIARSAGQNDMTFRWSCPQPMTGRIAVICQYVNAGVSAWSHPVVMNF